MIENRNEYKELTLEDIKNLIDEESSKIDVVEMVKKDIEDIDQDTLNSMANEKFIFDERKNSSILKSLKKELNLYEEEIKKPKEKKKNFLSKLEKILLK